MLCSMQTSNLRQWYVLVIVFVVFGESLLRGGLQNNPDVARSIFILLWCHYNGAAKCFQLQ